MSCETTSNGFAFSKNNLHANIYVKAKGNKNWRVKAIKDIHF